MTVKLNQAVASAHSVTVEGVTYFFTPLGVTYTNELLEWLKEQWFDQIKRNTADLPADMRLPLIREALAKLGMLDQDSPEIKLQGDTPVGCLRQMFYYLKPRHPDLDEEAVAKLLESQDLQTQFEAAAAAAETAAAERTEKKTRPRIRKKARSRRPKKRRK